MKMHHDAHHSAKAVIAFLILIVAFSILYLFDQAKENIILSGNFHAFVFLAFIGCSLLLTLLFLINKPHHQTTVKRSGSRKKKK